MTDRKENGRRCQRCGTCCEKGGPALHAEDRPLVDAGRIPAHCLYTIRRGERVHDNVRGRLTVLDAEIVKIAGRADGRTCGFYDRDAKGCRIYVHRPLECRVLNCRDTRRIEAVYASQRLTRADLLAGSPTVGELVETHEQHCSYARLRELVDQGLDGVRLKQEAAILEILRFDAHYRRLTVTRGNMDPRMMAFLFGRPMDVTLGMFDLRLVSRNGQYALIPGTAVTRRGRAADCASGLPVKATPTHEPKEELS